MSRSYQICSRCAMDTTDPDIVFDEDGVCSHCHEYEENLRRYVQPGEAGLRSLARLVDEMKAAGRGKPYDCVICVS